MKSLLLLRHAKSDWGVEYGEDHDRPLARRGRKAAARLGRLLHRADEVPDRIVSSTALRARETVRLAMEAGGWTCPVELAEGFYRSTPQEILTVVRSWDHAADRVLLAGHEPTWSALAGALIGGGTVRMPTAAAARIDFRAASWGELAFGEGTLQWLIVPSLTVKAKKRREG